MGEAKRKRDVREREAVQKLIEEARLRNVPGMSGFGAGFMLALYELGEDKLAGMFLDGMSPAGEGERE